MKIGFIYNGACDLVALTQNPSNNAALAVCQLAIELAKLDHNLTIFSLSENDEKFNVHCKHLEPMIIESDFAVLIFKNITAEFALNMTKNLANKPKIYIWTDYDPLSQTNKDLWDEKIVSQLAGIICVSPWQRTLILDSTHIPQNKLFLLKYAITPCFENLFADAREFINIKSKAPHVSYIANEDNGLGILLDSYYNISDNYLNSALGIFTAVNNLDMKLTIKSSTAITVYGDLPKSELAQKLRTFTIFANPNTSAATYNVTILEAMAAGLYPVTSDIAANADYCQGHGKIVRTDLLTSNTLDNYISELLAVCSIQIHQPESFYDYCYKQTIDINNKHTWRVRAKELLELLDHAQV